MSQYSRTILIFAVLFTILLIAPAMFSAQFGPYDLMKTGDAIDILTPIVLIPLYWLLFKAGREQPVTVLESVAFLILAAFWVEGQGMHLSANSIGHQLKGMESTDAYTLTEHYDEVLSHYLWHIGLIGLSALLMWRQWKYPFAENTSGWAEGVAALFHGITYFIIIVEAQTALIGVPFAVIVVIFVLLRARSKLGTQPLLAFFFYAYVIATILFAGWGIYWSGSDCDSVLPEFSDSCVGWID